jgi:hypothetical protein
MPSQPRHQVLKPRFTTVELYRLLDTYLRAGEDIAGRPLRLTLDAMRRSSHLVVRGLLGPWSAEQVLTGLAEEYANLLYGLMTTAPTAIESITSRLSNPPPGTLSQYKVPVEGATPQEHGGIIRLDHGTPFVVPARVIDASQGWAAWYVPKEKATALIDKDAREDFDPFDCGHGRCLVLLIGTDYRVSDFGRLQEIALAVCVTPTGGAAEPGALHTRIIVSDAFCVEPTRRIWGINKEYSESLRVYYEKTYAQFYTGEGVQHREFFLMLPRTGDGRSFDLPMTIYSIREQNDRNAIAGPARSILYRTGVDEVVQIGGRVELNLGKRHADNGPGNCFCSSGAKIACLCDELRGLGIDRTAPAANGWTERMTARMEAPGQLALQPFGNH